MRKGPKGFESGGLTAWGSGGATADLGGLRLADPDTTSTTTKMDWMPSQPSGNSFAEMTIASPDVQASRERRESRVTRGRLGSVAARLSGLFRGKGMDVASTFGVGGRIDASLTSAAGFVDRAQGFAVTNGAVDFSAQVPGLGSYVEAGRSTLGAIQGRTSEATAGYGNLAGTVSEAYGRRDQLPGVLREQGFQAAGRVGGAGANAALDVIGKRTGVHLGYEQDEAGKNKLKVRKVRVGKLAWFAAKTVMTGGGTLTKTGVEAARAGAKGARSAAKDELRSAQSWTASTARNAYESGPTSVFG